MNCSPFRVVTTCKPSSVSTAAADEARAELLKTVTEMASRGLRTLCLAYADVSADSLGPLASLEGGPPQLPLTVCCMLGIKVSDCKELYSSCTKLLTAQQLHNNLLQARL